MEKEKLKPAILIISETAHHDPSTDKAGEVLSDVFSSHGGDQWGTPEITIVPDDVLAIQRTVNGWCEGDQYVNLIVTSGGTGFATKDHTPEAIAPLLHRHASGLV